MRKRFFNCFFVLGFLFCPGSPVLAAAIEEEIAELKARLAVLEQKLAGQKEESGKAEEPKCALSKIEKELGSLSIGAGATFIVQGTDQANGDGLSRGGEDVVDASYSIDLGLEKRFDDYAAAFIHLETGDGAGVEDELQVFSSVNRDADDSNNSISVTEAWYEHYFKVLPLTLTFGKLDPTRYLDTNEYANCECTQFLGHIFRNSPVIEFPDGNAAGIRAAIEPADFLGAELAVIDTNADWEDAFNNIFFSGQLNFKANILEKAGNYRFYGWVNDKDHIKWNDVLRTKEENCGFGLSFDQELTDPLAVFTRYGWQEPEVYADGADFSLEQSWSAGIQLAGSLWGRCDDIFAVAFGQVMPSDDYKEANNVRADSEEHLEAYYNFKVNDHLSVSPDIQVIWNPYGGDAANGDKTIVVGGLRTQVDF